MKHHIKKGNSLVSQKNLIMRDVFQMEGKGKGCMQF